MYNPSQVKVVLDANGYAVYFSRSIVPYPRDGAKDIFLGHIGIYAFRFDILKWFVPLPVGTLEKIEKREQLRLLENRTRVRVVKTELTSLGVDRPEDFDKVSQMIGRNNAGKAKTVDLTGK